VKLESPRETPREEDLLPKQLANSSKNIGDRCRKITEKISDKKRTEQTLEIATT
jgi:hypothetical protein